MGARVVKSRAADHVFKMVDVNAAEELLLAGRGERAYVWVGPMGHGFHAGGVYTFTGPAALHALADAIRKHVPKPRKRKAAKGRERRK